MAPVSFHTLWQPDRPGTVSPLFPAGGSLDFPPVSCISQPGGKGVPGDLFSGAPSPELGGPRGPNSQGKAKAHGQVYAL